MKLSILSDLHLEFCVLGQDLPGGDILLMAGDIFGAALLKPNRQDAGARKAQKRAIAFCQKQLGKYDRVLMVMGNHEHYSGIFEASAGILRTFLAEHAPNTTLLDDEAIDIEGVRFLGTTLWGKCGVGTADEWRIANAMQDFSVIRTTRMDPEQKLDLRFFNGSRTFQPADAYLAHSKALRFLKAQLKAASNQPVVLLTHHAPSFQSAHGEEYGSAYLDAAYCANLVDMISKSPNIKLAVHGHTHHPEHYRIRETLVLANPRGYFPHEARSRHFDASACDMEFEDLFKERVP